MHIPDGFLSPEVAAATAVVSVGAVAYSLRRADRELDDERVPLLGVTAAFVFAVQMLNFPVAGGTSGHLLGAALAAILLGPWLACLVMAVVLTAQAFVFADGGISALGANVLNMGVIGALLVGFLMVWARHLIPRTRTGFLAVVASGAWIAVMTGAAATSIELAVSGTVPLGDGSAGDARCPCPDRSRRGRHHGRGGQRGARQPARPGGGPEPRATRADRDRRSGRRRCVMSRATSFRVFGRPRSRAGGGAGVLRLALRVRLARRSRTRRRGQGLRWVPRSRVRSRSARRFRATRSRASRTSGSPRASPDSWAPSACSRSATGPRTRSAGAGEPRQRRRGRGRVDGLCNHALELTGLAGDPASPVHRLDPGRSSAAWWRSRSSPCPRRWARGPSTSACALVLARGGARGRASPPRPCGAERVSCSPSSSSSGVFLPFFRKGGTAYELGPLTVSAEGLEVFGAVAAKATIGTVSAVLLGATTTFPAVLQGLEALRVPRVFTLIAAFMYRYLFVIVEETQRMRTALAARGYRPRSALQAAPIGRVGRRALFLRTTAAASASTCAMLARGYTRHDAGARAVALRRRRRAVRRRHRRRADHVADCDRSRRVSCAIHASGLDLSLPRRQARARRSDLARAPRRARRGARSQRRRQDDLDAAPQRPVARHGRARGGRRAGRARPARRAPRRASGSSSKTPTTSSSCRPSARTSRSARSTWALTPDEAVARVQEALAAVRMSHATDRAPHQLSMGERRRVAIATVLAMHPRLLVLDEPSANLDPRARRELLEVLERIDRTLLVVTHDLPFAAELCERAIILSGGRVVADEPARGSLRRGAVEPARSRAAPRLRPRADRAAPARRGRHGLAVCAQSLHTPCSGKWSKRTA